MQKYIVREGKNAIGIGWWASEQNIGWSVCQKVLIYPFEMHLLAYFLQAKIMHRRTENDKYQVCLYGFGCCNCWGVVKSAFFQMQAGVLLLWLLLVDSLSIFTAPYKLLECSVLYCVWVPECCIVSCLLGASWTVNSPTLAPTLYHLGILTCHQCQYFSRRPLCRKFANSFFCQLCNFASLCGQVSVSIYCISQIMIT